MVSIDLNRLTYGDYQAFLAGDLDEIEVLRRVIVAWDFAGDPAERESYTQLGLLDLLHVQRQLRSAIEALTSAEGNSAAPSL